MAANVRIAGESVQTDAPRELFPVSLGAFGAFAATSVYDVAPDGQRFLVESVDAERAPATLTVMLNWQAGLKK